MPTFTILTQMRRTYNKTLLLRPYLVLSKIGLISGLVLILNVEHSSGWGTFITKTCLFEYIENFTTKQMKMSDKKILIVFHISAQNRDWGSSNEYPGSMFSSRNKKNNVYPCKPQFYYIILRFKGSALYKRVFVMLHPKSNDMFSYLSKKKKKKKCCGTL